MFRSPSAKDVRTLLLVFSVATWVATGYWLNVGGTLDAAVIGVIPRDSFRQVGVQRARPRSCSPDSVLPRAI